MHPEVEELRPKLKEILYDCAVEIRATKAALFLADVEGKAFELVTEYGFRGAIRTSADRNDPIVDRCGRGRTPFFINGLTAEPRFSQLLYDSASERLLAAPVYVRGTLVGLVDMRDKAGKAAFDQTDVPKAQNIADRIGALFANMNVFGLRFIALSESGTHQAAPAPPPQQATTPAPPPPPKPGPASNAAPPVVKPSAHVPRFATLVVDARSRVAGLAAPAQQESIGETELAAVRDVLRAILLIPGAVTATFSAFGHMGGVQETASRSTLTDESAKVLQSKLNVWLSKRGEPSGFLRTTVQMPFGTAAPAITPAQLEKVFTAPVVAGSLKAMYLTVAFAGVPDRAAHEMLAAWLNQLQLTIEQTMSRASTQSARLRIAEKLLEPDFARYPELRRHTDLVVARVEHFSRILGMSPSDAENAKITAVVHDCGMRLLEYERLYNKKDLTPEELGLLREHVFVGAAIVEPLLGAEVARAVLCHHERVDGRGYPNELHGDDIPYLSRVLQICDAYVAMTDSESYQQRVETPEEAIAMIGRAAGTQFDAELARKFVDAMSRADASITARA